MTRDEHEAELARRLAQANREARRILSEALEDGIVTDDEWTTLARAFAQPLQAGLEAAYYDLSETAAAALGAPLDLEQVGRSASDWARQHTFDVGRRITATTQRLLQDSIADYFSERMALGDLQARIQRAFSPGRAATIAITETTRAAAAAEEGLAAELRKLGLATALVWQTARDDITCPVCSPRHNRRQGDGWNVPPPAHARCRCTLRTELVTTE